MTIEVATTINQLDHNLPDFQDFVSEGDDHERLIKLTLKNTFHNILGVVNPSHTELNFLVGVTSPVVDTAKLAALPAAIGNTTPVASTWSDLTVNGKLRAINNGAVGLATDLHSGQFGPTSGLNIAVGNGVIHGRNNGALAPLLLNTLGGQVALGGSDVASTVDLKNVRTRVQANSALVLQLQNMLDGAPAIGAAIDLNMGMYSSAGVRRAFLGFSAGLDFIVQNDSTAATVRIRGNNGAGVLREMIAAIAGGTVSLNYDNTARLQTTVTGVTTTGVHQMDALKVVGSGTSVLGGAWVFDSTGRMTMNSVPLAVSGDMGFQVGPSTGDNLALSAEGLQGRQNGIIDTILLNNLGGDVVLGRASGGSARWSDANKTLFLENGAKLEVTGVITVLGSAISNFLGIINAADIRKNGIEVVDEQRAVNTATGLQGGGFLNADRTIDYAFNALTAQGKIEYDDMFILRDVSTGVHTRAYWRQIKEMFQVSRSVGTALGITDAFTQQIWTSTGNGSLSLPPPGSDTFEGNRIEFLNWNTGSLTILGAGVYAKGYDTITRRGGRAVATFSGNTWFVDGDLGDPITTGRFESSAVALAVAGAFTHGLGGVPDGFAILFRATAAILGYVAGDEVNVLGAFAGGGDPTVWADAAQIGWGMPTTGMGIFQKGSSATGTMTTGWTVVGKAWRYRQ